MIKTEIIGKLPISAPFYIDLYSFETGEKMMSDTLDQEDFVLTSKSLPKGIYQIVFSWERNVVKPQEIERFARQPELGTPKYYISTIFWLDPNECGKYKFLLESPGKQAELEELLLAKNGSESIKMAVVSGGKNNKLYNEYLTLVDRYKDKNRHQKDSLQQVAVRYSDHKFLQEVGRIQKLLSKDWLDNVKNELLADEIDFMKRNIDNEVIHRIYQIQLNNREDVERYREIYNLFPFNVRQNLAASN
ncbi:hypothetical protein [Sphingobacterium siyangense]|uniref:hypothetical protein n=1 Tax=Sphingobacterium siyangense TaxID=459529 RepID=UPI0028AA2FFC|nr:hypothetical protein [Sphingobacterium siyangense]